MRPGFRLTKEAEDAREEFIHYDMGCSCHISPPCSGCTHPGNPANQDEDDSCWEPDTDEEGAP